MTFDPLNSSSVWISLDLPGQCAKSLNCPRWNKLFWLDKISILSRAEKNFAS